MAENHVQEVTVAVHTDTAEVDAVTEKAERLTQLLKEANSLVDALASNEINISVNVE